MSYTDLDNSQLHYAANPKLSENEQWILTLGASLSAYNGDYINAIETRYELSSIKEGIQAMWSINDKASFENIASWLIQEGHRNQYQRQLQHLKPYISFCNACGTVPKFIFNLVPRFSVMWYQIKNKIDLRVTLKELGFDKIDEQEKNGTFVNLFTDSLTWSKLLADNRLGDVQTVNNLLAWDAVRLVNICRWSLLLGYINHEEFLNYANALKTQIQTAYNSWQEVALAYAVGGLIWRGEEERAEALAKPLNLIITDPNSPFNTVLFK